MQDPVTPGSPGARNDRLRRAGLCIAAIGLAGIWVPVAALAGFLGLWAVSSPGIGEHDWPLFGYAVLVTVAVPLVGWFAFRTRRTAAAVLIILVGILVPLTFVPQVQGFAEPLQWVAQATIVFAAIAVVGGLVLILAARRR
jgi:hypothetical protein